MNTIIGCGEEHTGGFDKCVDCPLHDEPDSCLFWRRAKKAKTIMRPADEGLPKLFPEVKKMEIKGPVKLTFRKSNVYPMPEQKFIPAYLSKKLYERCIKTCHPDTIQAHRARMNHILSMKYQLSWATYVQFGKYTVVELEYNGKHYHGLAALAPCDMRTTSAGIAVAYKRAFENMLEATLWH